MNEVVARLREFIENEMRSCSMDLTLSRPLTLDNVKASFPLYSLNRGLGGITPEYVLFICIQDNTQKENSGLIILINKTHDEQREGAHDFDVITRDNVFATYLSALYLHQFGLWNSAVSRKNYLLKKLRHEIPNCT
ncbi:MAG: hypothetical protein K6F74_10670 [Prevotella sp.]|nr:hypothetical protein [Prevotella sp.]